MLSTCLIFKVHFHKETCVTQTCKLLKAVNMKLSISIAFITLHVRFSFLYKSCAYRSWAMWFMTWLLMRHWITHSEPTTGTPNCFAFFRMLGMQVSSVTTTSTHGRSAHIIAFIAVSSEGQCQCQLSVLWSLWQQVAYKKVPKESINSSEYNVTSLVFSPFLMKLFTLSITHHPNSFFFFKLIVFIVLLSAYAVLHFWVKEI